MIPPLLGPVEMVEYAREIDTPQWLRAPGEVGPRGFAPLKMAAAAMGFQPDNVRRRCAAGDIPAVLLAGAVYIPVAAVAAEMGRRPPGFRGRPPRRGIVSE